MKKITPIIPENLPTYHIMTTYVQYLVYLYEQIPETSSLLEQAEMDNLHDEFYTCLITVIKSMGEKSAWSTRADDESPLPIQEIEALVRVYSPDIIPFSIFRRSWESRSSRIDEILSHL